jgi:hypothetical protein
MSYPDSAQFIVNLLKRRGWSTAHTCSPLARGITMSANLPSNWRIRKSQSKSKLYYERQSFGQSVLVWGTHLEPATNSPFFFFLYWQLRISCCGAPSLTRGRVSNTRIVAQLRLGLARAVTLESKSRRTHDHILLSHLRLPQPGGQGPRIYIPPEQGGPVIPLGTGVPFCRLLRLAGQRFSYCNPPPHPEEWDLSTISYIGIQFVPHRNRITSF